MDQVEVHLVGVVLEEVEAAFEQLLFAGQEHHPDAVLPLGGQFLTLLGQLTGEELVGYLYEDAGSVAAVRFAAAGAAVLHVDEHREGVTDQLVGGFAVQVGDEAGTTGVRFGVGNVEAGGAGRIGLVAHGNGLER